MLNIWWQKSGKNRKNQIDRNMGNPTKSSKKNNSNDECGIQKKFCTEINYIFLMK